MCGKRLSHGGRRCLLPFVLGSLALAAFEARQRWGGRTRRAASTQFDGG